MTHREYRQNSRKLPIFARQPRHSQPHVSCCRIAIFFLTVNAMSLSVFEFFDCQRITPSLRVLAAIPAINCDSMEYTELIPVYVAMAVLLGVAPIALLLALI